MGGRGANSGMPESFPGGGGGGKGGPMDQMPGNPDTLAQALGKKGRPMSTRDAVMKANPFFDRSASTAEYNENCQRCVVATEARFRGYDVVASPTYDGDTMPSHGQWKRNFVGAKTDFISKSTPAAAQRAVEAKMKQYGNGARAVLSVSWKGSRLSGHVLNVVQRGGRTYFYDGQNGSVVNAKALFSSCRPRDIEITRVDNLTFSDQAREAVRTTPRNRRKQ